MSNTPSLQPETNTVVFNTPGHLPLEALTTMGISAKPNSSSPIGMFGTGLKYALAILAREQITCTITLWDGTQRLDVYSLGTSKSTFRDEPITKVILNHKPTSRHKTRRIELPFTTHLGNHWSLENAYRELESNTRDEGGTTTAYRTMPEGSKLFTSISIHSPEFASIHAESWRVFLDSTPLDSTPQIELHRATPFTPQATFYRGIKVGERLASEVRPFIYNLLCPMELTEDRTLLYPFMEHSLITSFWRNQDDPDLLIELFKSEPSDSNLLHDLQPHSVDEGFIHALKAINKNPDTASFIPTLVRFAFRKELGTKAYTLSEGQEADLGFCIRILKSQGFCIYPIQVEENLPNNLIGLANLQDNVIVLSPQAFLRGRTYLLSTLLEETLHIQYRVGDYTREFQDIALDLLANALIKSEKN